MNKEHEIWKLAKLKNSRINLYLGVSDTANVRYENTATETALVALWNQKKYGS